MELLQALLPIGDLKRLRRDQLAVVLLLVGYFVLSMTSVSMVKALQNAVYLGKVGFDWRLPTLYLGIALLSGPLVLMYRWLAGIVSHLLITSLTILFLAAGLGVFWLALGSSGGWAYQAFYIWGAIFSVLLPTQGWIFAYHLFSARVAKRVFVLLGTGGVLGGVFGGYYTALTAETLGSELLFLHVLGLLALLQAILCAVFWVTRGVAAPARKESGANPSGERVQTVKTVLRTRHLKYLAALILLTGLASTMVDLLYKWSLSNRFPGSEAEITEFFGGLLGTTYLMSAVVQVAATGVILRRFGLGVGLVVLPLGLVFGSLGILATAAFWAVVVAKALDGSLRSSVEQTSVELLYVPLSDLQSIPLKSFMELVMLRLGDGVGAALFLLLVAFTPDPVRLVGGVLLAVCGVWLWVTRGIAEEYVQMLRRSLEYGSKAVRRALALDEAVAESTLLAALTSTNIRKIQFALNHLRQQESELELGDITSTDLAGEVLSMDASSLYRTRKTAPRWVRVVEALTVHPEPEVAAAALDVAIGQGLPGYLRRLRQDLRGEDLPQPRDLLYLADYADDPGSLLNPAVVQHWCSKAEPRQAVLLTRLLGAWKNLVFLPILRAWTAHQDVEVRRSAIQALGSYGQQEDLSLLFGFLNTNWSRAAARRALAQYGEVVVNHLMAILRDPRADISLKREIPAILAQIDTSSARGVLVAALYTHDSGVAYRALRALNRIRSQEDLSYNQESFMPLLQIWAREYYGLLNLDLLLQTRQGPASRLLQKVVKERLDWSIEKIFRGLDLFLPLGDAYFSYLGFTSSRQDLRDNAVELIDSRIRGELRQTLLPIFAEFHPFDVVRKGREIFKLPAERDSALSELFFHGDPWLKCCTIAAVLEEKLAVLKPRVVQACEDIHPMVRETARWALERWDQGEATAG